MNSVVRAQIVVPDGVDPEAHAHEIWLLLKQRYGTDVTVTFG
jgi:hypothetical protein